MFKGELFVKALSTIPLQILLKLMLHSKVIFKSMTGTDDTCHRAALTTHELEWLEHWGKLAELERKCSNRELVYVGNTNVTQST